MIFKEGQAIFIQIAERICDEILAGKYEADARIPGVRDYSVTLEVNVNTTVKAYEQLAQRGVIYNKRGLGYFVAADAQSQILKTRRETFFNSELPELVVRMRQLGVTPEDIKTAYEKDNASWQVDVSHCKAKGTCTHPQPSCCV